MHSQFECESLISAQQKAKVMPPYIVVQIPWTNSKLLIYMHIKKPKLDFATIESTSRLHAEGSKTQNQSQGLSLKFEYKYAPCLANPI